MTVIVPQPVAGSRWWKLFPLAMLIVCAALATHSLLRDSLTFDEMIHLTCGLSYLETGDFRLAFGTPPLAQVWAALPVWLGGVNWPAADLPAWRNGDVFGVGHAWFYDLNHGEALLVESRLMIVVLLIATCWMVYRVTRELFGVAAARISLTLAALSPTLLAHGRLVTTDLPSALAFLLCLWTFARAIDGSPRPRLMRLLAAGASFAALCLTKFSWPLVLPALGVMAIVAMVRARAQGRRAGGRVVGVAVCMGLVAWLAIWTAHDWRYSTFAGGPPLKIMPLLGQSDAQAPATMDDAWREVLAKAGGERHRGLAARVIAAARDWRLLPEAYLYAFAFSSATSHGRTGYLMGAISNNGWLSYFPIAFAIKTPVATMVLIVLGIAAVRRRASIAKAGGRSGHASAAAEGGRYERVATVARGGGYEAVLWVGLMVFVATYAAAAIFSRFNIGQRHLLPIYPVLFIIAGASSAWLASRAGRFVIGACLVWLAGSTLWNHPHYLGYFNELIGGPANGYHYLADSNLDWGQDLKRLAAFARARPDRVVNLSYFGSADPTRYGFVCHLLPSSGGSGDAAKLEPGTYVISVTNLLGAYQWYARDDVWRLPRTHQIYADLARSLPQAPPADADEKARAAWQTDREHFELLRWGRFLQQLRHVPPTSRVGRSLFVYELGAADIATLTRPQ